MEAKFFVGKMMSKKEWNKWQEEDKKWKKSMEKELKQISALLEVLVRGRSAAVKGLDDTEVLGKKPEVEGEG